MKRRLPFAIVPSVRLLALTLSLLLSCPANSGELPGLLSETGLFNLESPGTIASNVVSFSPQFPLWSDGASKRRWIYLPPGSSIDASRPDAWQFPVGTKLWKEFAFGKAVETRMIEHLADGSWRFAAYVWRQDGSDAELAPIEGVPALELTSAPGGVYRVPSEMDCRACHEGSAVPVLGFSAVQLAADRDPGALHTQPVTADDVDLPELMARGLLRNLPTRLLDKPPRSDVPSATTRSVLGYLHANCGHCHNDPEDSGAGVPVDLILAQYVNRTDSRTAVLQSLRGTTSRFRISGEPVHNKAELVLRRMASRDPNRQMPPLGTHVADTEALSLIERWIGDELFPTDH